MNFKKRVNGSWDDTPNYIHKTDTDTFTTLPADIYPTGTTAMVGLKGQTVQSSTPSPTSPVMPQGTGERTGNLAPPLLEWIDGYVASNGRIGPADKTYKEKSSDYISIGAGKTYTFSMENGFPDGTNYSWRAIGWYAQDKTFISRASGNANVALSTNAPSNAAYCRLSYRTHGETTNPMLNAGSTALPYEPYGYKIPISSANTTTPVYLGEVETTRRIKKLVLTGDVAFTQTSNYQQSSRFRLVINDALRGADTYTVDTIISTHYKSETGFEIGTIAQSNGIDINCTFCMQSSAYPDLTTFKSYLAAQYAAGTPVTVWYVLATPTTGIVNEPLMKIGEYADEVSGISIPVTTGGDSFDVLTTLKPSEVELTYTGWHDASVKEWDGSQWS